MHPIMKRGVASTARQQCPAVPLIVILRGCSLGASLILQGAALSRPLSKDEAQQLAACRE